MSNIVTAVFEAGACGTVTLPLFQWDYGQVLQFQGLELPDTYEVHFANTDSRTSVTMLGNAYGVDIPDACLTSGEPIYAWVFLHTGESDGETEYTVSIPVIARAEPSDIEPTPVQQDVITQAIAALNSGVTRAETAAESSQNDALMAKSYAVGNTGTRENEDTDNAKYYAEEAETSKIVAGSSADDARASAMQANTAYRGAQTYAGNASLSATRAATSETNAKGYADIASAVVEAAQAVLDSIPEDYTALQDDVEGKLDRVQDAGYANKVMVIGNNGALVPGEAPVPVAVRSALIDIFRHVAYTDDQGAQMLAALESAMAVRTLSAISAAINQGSTIIYTDDGLDQLRPLMTVTATYSDGTTAVISDYTLTGTLAPGECVIGVQYGGMMDTVTVTATQPEVTVVALTVDFDPDGATIYTSTPLSDLRQYLTVMALYSNGMSAEASTYTIEGTLREGANTLTVRFKGQYALFSVTAAAPVPVRLEAVYNPPAGYVVYTDDDLDKVAAYLTVTEYYNDGSGVVVTDYTLTGTLVDGMSTVLVRKDGLTTTVQVEAVDFYNIMHWSTEDNITFVSLHSIREDNDGNNIRIEAATSAIRNAYCCLRGQKPIIDGATREPTQYYPIPIPAGATGITARTTDATVKLYAYIFTLDSDGYHLTHGVTGWKTGEQIESFEAGSGKYVGVTSQADTGLTIDFS